MEEFGIDNVNLETIITRPDGTYEITRLDNGWPYHVTPDYCPELYAQVKAQAEK